jgi:hypothetical protein
MKKNNLFIKLKRFGNYQTNEEIFEIIDLESFATKKSKILNSKFIIGNCLTQVKNVIEVYFNHSKDIVIIFYN